MLKNLQDDRVYTDRMNKKETCWTYRVFAADAFTFSKSMTIGVARIFAAGLHFTLTFLVVVLNRWWLFLNQPLAPSPAQ